MKKTINLLFASLFLCFFACEDAIDIDQPGRLDTGSAFQSIDDLQLGLLGAYNNLDITYQMSLTSRFTDEVYTGEQNGGQGDGLLNFNISPTTGEVANIWSSNYSAIWLANRIIDAAASLDRADDPTAYDDILGQAHAIRAFAHFQILTYFSTDYTDDNALAGILIDFAAPDIFVALPRNTNGEFYTLINSDLDTAAALITTDQGNKFMGQDFITALRARMAAYRGNYTQADTYAAQLLLSYPIANQTQFTNMFDDADFTEVIFSLERSVGDDYDGQGTAGGGWAGSLFAFIDAGASGGPFLEISRATYNIMDGTSDVRLSRSVNLAQSSPDPGYVGNPNFLNDDILLVFKYPGSGGQPLMNDLKVFRAAEMLLIRAEAAADANDLAAAAGFVKQLRDARFGFPQSVSFANQTEAFGAILDERRLELLFEGHRWVDLKRIGARGNRSIDRDTYECSFLAGCTLPTSDHRFTLPIPQIELDGNVTIRTQQNPGY